MKVFALMGGLGSQMLKYSLYLAIKEKCEDNEVYIDTSYYYFNKAWNGYELGKIFNIDAKNYFDLYSLNYIRYPVQKNKLRFHKYIIKNMLQKAKSISYFYLGNKKIYNYLYLPNTFLTYFIYRVVNIIANFIKINIDSAKFKNITLEELINIENFYFDEYNQNSDILFEDIKDRIFETFKFPDFSEPKNISIFSLISTVESVAIHIRRGDHLYDNNDIQENNYYSRAIDYFETKFKNLSYFIFSDDSDWCKNNIDKLNLENKNVYFIDWNSGEDSYRDMQLMSLCKHQILAISSFSWWAHYLNTNPNKISCAPLGFWDDVKVHF